MNMTVRDLENDGCSDIIWWGSDGTFGYWDMDGGVPTWRLIGNVSRNDYTFMGVGDFNQNGGRDIFWYGKSLVGSTPGANNTTTQNFQDLLGYWSMDANGGVLAWDVVQINSVSVTGVVGQPATNVQTGNFLKIYYFDRLDFTGEGRADYITEVNGTFSIQVLNEVARPETTQTFNPGAGWKISALNDFNADGRSDILWRNLNSNEVGIYLLDNGIVQSWTSFGFITQDWEVVATGALGGDSKGSIIWHNTNTHQYGIWLMQESGATVLPVWKEIGYIDPSWKIQGSGDYWGDGTDDILWRNVNTGTVQMWNYNFGEFAGAVSIDGIPTSWSIV